MWSIALGRYSAGEFIALRQRIGWRSIVVIVPNEALIIFQRACRAFVKTLIELLQITRLSLREVTVN